jgi:hypothetical protein
MKTQQVIKGTDGIRRYIDTTGRVWVITREALPKKRGEYIYWWGESNDGNAAKAMLRSELVKEIEDRFGSTKV